MKIFSTLALNIILENLLSLLEFSNNEIPQIQFHTFCVYLFKSNSQIFWCRKSDHGYRTVMYMDVSNKKTALSVFYYLRKIYNQIDIEKHGFSYKLFKGINSYRCTEHNCFFSNFHCGATPCLLIIKTSEFTNK